jgi:thiamine biosynthesis lipoprotein ApbE
MMADAYATAFMSMGLSKALHTATKIEDIEYLFIYIDDNNILSKQHSSGVFDMIPSSGNEAEE